MRVSRPSQSKQSLSIGDARRCVEAAINLNDLSGLVHWREYRGSGFAIVDGPAPAAGAVVLVRAKSSGIVCASNEPGDDSPSWAEALGAAAEALEIHIPSGWISEQWPVE